MFGPEADNCQQRRWHVSSKSAFQIHCCALCTALWKFFALPEKLQTKAQAMLDDMSLYPIAVSDMQRVHREMMCTAGMCQATGAQDPLQAFMA